MKALGVSAHEIDIGPAATQMLKDIGHEAAEGEKRYDITFENVQAGARTSILYRLANRNDALVLGTATCPNSALAGAPMALATIWSITTSTPPSRKPDPAPLALGGGEKPVWRGRSRTLTPLSPPRSGPELVPGEGVQTGAEDGRFRRALRLAGFQPVPHHPLTLAPVENRLPVVAHLA